MNPPAPSILIVDDEPDTCANLRDILVEIGYRADTATCGEEALQRVSQSHFDIALIDLRMPGIDGLELYRRIRKLGAGTVGIIISAYASSEATEAALNAGAWRVLSKPVDFPVLARLIDQALDQPLVLIVDDDRSLCETLLDVLEEHGYRACVASSVSSAGERLSDQSYQVVLIDMKLPEGNGYDVYQLVRSFNPDAHTILISGYHNEAADLISQVLNEGADAVCYKPFDMDQLLGAIRSLTQHSSP